MPDIIHRIGIAQSANGVYKALSTDAGLSRWWTKEAIETGSGKPFSDDIHIDHDE